MLRFILLFAIINVLQSFMMAFYSDFYTNLLSSKAFVVLFVFSESVVYVPALVLNVILYVFSPSFHLPVVGVVSHHPSTPPHSQ